VSIKKEDKGQKKRSRKREINEVKREGGEKEG